MVTLKKITTESFTNNSREGLKRKTKDDARLKIVEQSSLEKEDAQKPEETVNQTENSSVKSSYPCDKCDKVYAAKSSINLDKKTKHSKLTSKTNNKDTAGDELGNCEEDEEMAEALEDLEMAMLAEEVERQEDQQFYSTVTHMVSGRWEKQVHGCLSCEEKEKLIEEKEKIISAKRNCAGG